MIPRGCNIAPKKDNVRNEGGYSGPVWCRGFAPLCATERFVRDAFAWKAYCIQIAFIYQSTRNSPTTGGIECEKPVVEWKWTL